MPAIRSINHVAIVVDDLDAALDFWRDSLGLQLSHVEEVPAQGALVAFLPLGESEVELVKPTTNDSGIARYLAKRGPGVHHICFEVDDLDAALERLKEENVRLINERPTIGAGGKRIAFIHPSSAHGVLIELYETSLEEQKVRLARARQLARKVRTGGVVLGAAMQAFLRVWINGSEDNEKETA